MPRRVQGFVNNLFSENLKNTAFLRFFGLTKVPLLFWIRPSVTELTDSVCTIKVPLSRRTKNHLNSMYFGVLAAGADLAAGLVAMKTIKESGVEVSLSFKEFKATFLKRAEGDTHFTCSQGLEITQFVQQVIESGIRQEMPLFVSATCPALLGNEKVAEFELLLSLKRRVN